MHYIKQRNYYYYIIIIYRLDLAEHSLAVLPSHREVVVLPLHQSQLVLSPHEVHPRLVGPSLQLLAVCEGRREGRTRLLKLTQGLLSQDINGLWLRMGEWWFVSIQRHLMLSSGVCVCVCVSVCVSVCVCVCVCE